MKKLITMLMATIMMLTMATTAFADDETAVAVTSIEIATEAEPVVEEVEVMAQSNGISTFAATTYATNYVAQYYSATYGTWNSTTSLSNAISWAQEGTTVTLLSNVSVTSQISTSKNFTLDLAGYTITSSNTNIPFWLTGDVTIMDNSEANTGTIKSTYTEGSQYIVLVNDGGSLTFTGGTLVSSYVGIQYGNGGGAGAGTMSGDAAISATRAIAGTNTSSFTVSGGYLPTNTGAYSGTLAYGYGISANAETDGVFEGLYKVYELPETVTIDETKYYSVIDAVEASAYGDDLVMTTSATVTQSFTLRTGTTFTMEDGVTLTLTENTSMMNCSNSDVTVYYDGDAYEVKSGELFTAKTLGTPTYVDTESELITALQADKPYIVMTDDITIYKNSLSNAYVTDYYSGTLDGGNYTLTLSAGTEDSGFNLVYYPNDGMVMQNMQVKLESQPSALCVYQGVTGSRIVLDNITIVDSEEVFAIGNNWSPFFAHNFGHLIMKDCVNEQNFTATGYQAIFIGGYMNTGATTAFVDCVNNGSLIGENVALFLGNPNNGENLTASDVYVTGCENNSVLRGTITAEIFSKNNNSVKYDKFIDPIYATVEAGETWQFVNKGTVEVAAAYELSGTIDTITGVISITDNTNTATSYGVKMWGYAAIENGGGTSSTFAIMKADSVEEFNGAGMIFGTIIDDITFASEHSGVETYTAPWGENVFAQQPYEITVIDNKIYYVFDINDNCALNNTSPRVDIYAYDADGYVVASATLSSSGVTPSVSSIDMLINDAAFLGTFAQAVAAAADGDTITLLTDVVASETATVSDKTITLDLNGNDLTFGGDYGIANSGTLNIKDSVGDGVLDGSITNNENCTIAILGGLFTATLDSTWAATGYEVTTVTVEGTVYNTIQPASTVEYTVSGNTIYGKLDGVTVGKMSILAPTELEYDGSAKVASIYEENSGVLSSQTIVYNTTDGNAPTEAGTYTASITATIDDVDYTASITFAISRVSVSFKSSNNSFEYGSTPTVSYENTSSLTADRDYTVTYTDTNGNTVELNSETPVGTYTIVVTITNSNYKLSGTVGSVVVYEVEEPTKYTVTYVYNDEGKTENSTTDDEIATTVRTLESTPSYDGYTFAGWTYNGKIYTAGATFVQPEADVTMTATWIKNEMVVSGVVTDNDDEVVVTAIVTLENVSGTEKTTATTETGSYSFKDIAPGTYTLSVTKDDVTASKTITVGTVDVEENFKMTELTTKTTVVVEEGLTETSVSNLENVTSTAVDGTTAETSVEVKLVVAAVEDTVAETAVTDAVANATVEIGHMVDISINAIVDENEISTISEILNNIEITIALPAEIQGMATYKVYRYHVDENGNGSVDILTTSPNSNDEYIVPVTTPMTVVGEDGTESTVDVTTSLTIHAKYFSTYAIASSDVVEVASTGSVKKYSNSLEVGDNGSAYATPLSASSGTTVYINVTPDSGYEVDEVLVDGGDITVTDNEDGTYSYKQPAYAVDIEVTFVATGDVEVEEEVVEEESDEALTDFEDVVAGAWYEEYIAAAVEEGIMQGNSETEFAPNGTTTRAMMIQVLFNMSDQPETENDEAAWYSEALAWGMEFGITDGSDITGDLTREQLVTMLYRYAMSNGVDTTAVGDLTTFGDAENVADWAADAFAWAVGEGIINGDTDGNLNPDGNATRAELAKIMVSYLAL